MFSLSALLEHNWFIALFVAVSLLATEYVKLKKQSYYNNEIKKNASHILNRKFGWDQKRRLPYEKINYWFTMASVIAICIGTIVICIDIRKGIFTTIGLYTIVNIGMTYYLGHKFSSTK